MTINLPQEVETILNLLSKSGYEAYIVGGCVRDSLLNRVPHDWDICTSAKPNEIQEVFKDYKTIETGLKYGTLTTIMNNISYEVTTYRIDGEYSDNRHPDMVQFTNSLYEDLSRRDFTINAMAYNHKDGLIDYFNGVEDLKNGVIKCVGKPTDRFTEDSLRILRAIRFACNLRFDCTRETTNSMLELKLLLNNISIERINTEFIKTLNSYHASYYLDLYKDIFTVFIPEIRPMFNFKQNNSYHIKDVWHHTLTALHSYDGEDLIIKLTLLFHDIGKPKCYIEDEYNIGHFYKHSYIGAEITRKIMLRMRFDNITINKVTELVEYHDINFSSNSKSVKRLLNKLGEEQLRRLLEVRRADIKGQNLFYLDRLDEVNDFEKVLNIVLNEKQCFTMKLLAVNGNDLMDIGYKQNKVLGSALNGLLHCVIAEEVDNNKIELLKLAKKWIE